MALARKHGQNPHNWGVIRDYILRLSQPAYYTDPVVKYGYMRGTETVNYVDRIRARWGNIVVVQASMRAFVAAVWAAVPSMEPC